MKSGALDILAALAQFSNQGGTDALSPDVLHGGTQAEYEAFVQGFVAARDPKSATDTLKTCADADTAYVVWREATKANDAG